MHIIIYVLLPFLIYFIWTKVLTMYFRLIYYRRQGMPCAHIPWPLLGNIPRLFGYFTSKDIFAESPMMEYYKDAFKGKKVPGAFVDFLGYNESIFFSDPEMINEIYVTKNKYFEKHPKFQRIQNRLLGGSILFSESTELWAKKRKSLS